MVLGNAYLAVFFKSNQDNRLLQQCANAYVQAVSVDPPTLLKMTILYIRRKIKQFRVILTYTSTKLRYTNTIPIIIIYSTWEPLNKGHNGASHFVLCIERLFALQRCKMYPQYGRMDIRDFEGCPL